MIEVEIKVPLTNEEFMRIQNTILKLGGKYLNSESQEDTYYDHPCRSFKETDEAIRVRRSLQVSHEGSKAEHAPCELVYKGPKLDTKSKTRLELSISISDSAVANMMLKELSFRNVATIIKKRIVFEFRSTTICMDNVEDVGFFMELERLVPVNEELGPVREQLFEIVRNLGINPENSIRKSYLELYLERKDR